MERAVLWFLEEIIIQCFYYLRLKTKTLNCRNFFNGVKADRSEWLGSAERLWWASSCKNMSRLDLWLDSEGAETFSSCACGIPALLLRHHYAGLVCFTSSKFIEWLSLGENKKNMCLLVVCAWWWESSHSSGMGHSSGGRTALDMEGTESFPDCFPWAF